MRLSPGCINIPLALLAALVLLRNSETIVLTSIHEMALSCESMRNFCFTVNNRSVSECQYCQCLFVAVAWTSLFPVRLHNLFSAKKRVIHVFVDDHLSHVYLIHHDI